MQKRKPPRRHARPAKPKRQHPTLWITDSWSTLAPHPKETTLRLMEAALALGHATYWADNASLAVKDGVPSLKVHTLGYVTKGRSAESFLWNQENRSELGDFHAVHYRPDPPVTLEYIERLKLVARGVRGSELINSESLLLSASEKLVPEPLLAYAPRSLITSDLDAILVFAKEEGQIVIKSLHGAKSEQVIALTADEAEDRAKSTTRIASLGVAAGIPVFAQEFLPAVHDGELRAWFARGRFIAALVKHPLKSDFRVQIDLGSRVESANPTAAQKKTLGAVAAYLKKHRVGLAAVDLIGDKISDFNLTSPGLLVELEEVHKRDFASQIIKILASDW